jgi:hypothetical protein
MVTNYTNKTALTPSLLVEALPLSPMACLREAAPAYAKPPLRRT